MNFHKFADKREFQPDVPKDFKCGHCRRVISGSAPGTLHRNHCPICLWSRHLDNRPGDRAAECGGLMEPVGVWVKDDGEWAILHRCERCGEIHANRIAGDDCTVVLIALAMKPVVQPPFPLQDEAQYLPLFRKR